MASDRAEARSNADWARDRRVADGVERERPVQHHEDDAPAQPADTADATPVAEAPVAEAPAVQAPAVAVTAPDVQQQVQAPVETQTQAQTQVASAQTAAPQKPVQQEQPVAQAQDAVPAPAEAVKPHPQAVVAEQAAVTNADEEASVQQQQPVESKPADAKPVQAAPVAASAAKPKQGQPEAGQQNESQQQGSLPQPAAEQARTVAQAYGRSAQQHTSTEVPTTAQSGTPAAPAATPVASGQPAAARGEPAPATPVPLTRAAETVEHVMRLASSRGVTHARIALTPESLGSIDVHLRHTADGLVARLVAHAPEAVQQLQQAAADLRQQLQGQGVNLLSLDIGHAADEGFAARADAGLADDGGRNSSGTAESGDAAAGADAEVTVNSTLQLPDGVLVDVLA